MVDALIAVLLGAIQGLTEFLPVSSTAHLVAAQSVLDFQKPGIGIEIAAHVGTLVAIVVVFLRPLMRVVADGVRGLILWLRRTPPDAIRAEAPLFPTAVAVAVGTVPGVLAGVLLEAHVKAVFENLAATGSLLCVTGLALLATRHARTARIERVGPWRGLLIGIAQAVALLPGISRSGATIATGMFLGVKRGEAARFSFVLVVPALIGAPLYEIWRSRGATDATGAVGTSATVPELLLVAGTSAVVGTVCLVALLRVVRGGKLHWFAAYCLPVGAAMAVAGLLMR